MTDTPAEVAEALDWLAYRADRELTDTRGIIPALRAHYANLERQLAEAREDNERLKGAFDDEDERASVHWYGRWVAEKRARIAAEAQLAAQRERDGRLRDACEGLLAFIREKYPQDFADGGRGYICPHHLAIDAALKDRP